MTQFIGQYYRFGCGHPITARDVGKSAPRFAPVGRIIFVGFLSRNSISEPFSLKTNNLPPRIRVSTGNCFREFAEHWCHYAIGSGQEALS